MFWFSGAARAGSEFLIARRNRLDAIRRHLSIRCRLKHNRQVRKSRPIHLV